MEKGIYTRKSKKDEKDISEQMEEIFKFAEDENLVNFDTDKAELEKRSNLRKKFDEVK